MADETISADVSSDEVIQTYTFKLNQDDFIAWFICDDKTETDSYGCTKYFFVL